MDEVVAPAVRAKRAGRTKGEGPAQKGIAEARARASGGDDVVPDHSLDIDARSGIAVAVHVDAAAHEPFEQENSIAFQAARPVQVPVGESDAHLGSELRIDLAPTSDDRLGSCLGVHTTARRRA